MKKLLLLFFLFSSSILLSQVKLLSWNVENLGSSKSEKDIISIANTIKDYDIIVLINGK